MRDGGARAPPSSFAAGDVLADDVEQAARLLRVEVGIVADAEDPLPAPVAAPRLVPGVDDDALEGRPSQELLDERGGAVQLKVGRIHTLPRRAWRGRASSLQESSRPEHPVVGAFPMLTPRTVIPQCMSAPTRQHGEPSIGRSSSCITQYR